MPNERIVWTNDEGEEGAVTTVTFEDQGGAAALPEQLEQLDELLSSKGE